MILCCGEALIDMIPDRTIDGADAFVPCSGGAVMNTAVALGRLGADAGFCSGLSEDLFGQQLRSHLSASRVDLSHVTMSARPSTLAFVQLENGQANYCFMDENSAGRMLSPGDIPPLSNDVSTLFFGGISLAVEPAADTYATLLEKEKQNRVVMLDPNIRESFIHDPARYRARLNRMLAQTDIIKVSDEDLAWLIPDVSSLDAGAQEIMARGPRIVVVTCGADGAIAYTRNNDPIKVATTPVDVVDTVGAGDTFNAGFLFKLEALDCLSADSLSQIAPEHLSEAVAFGSKVAGITVARKGANPPWAQELEVPA